MTVESLTGGGARPQGSRKRAGAHRLRSPSSWSISRLSISSMTSSLGERSRSTWRDAVACTIALGGKGASGGAGAKDVDSEVDLFWQQIRKRKRK